MERDVTDLEAALREAVDTLFPEEKTYETAAVIVPDEKTAERAYLILREILAEKDFDCEKRLSWLNRDSSSFKKGLTVTTFYLAKGLEFDQVFSIFPKDEKREMMMQAQYIAATRALHELRVSKEFQIGNYPMLISQLSVMDTDQVMAMQDEILAEMARVCTAEGYAMSIVIVTDIINEGSYFLFSGEPKNLIGEAFKQDASKSVMYLPGVMSRKKQIIPPLSEAVKNL